MANQEYVNWVKEQATKHKASDKISALSRATSNYIINEYDTWGDLFNSVGVKEDIKKTKPKTSTTPTRTLDDVATDLNKWQGDVTYAKMRMKSYSVGSAEYDEAKSIYDTALPKVTQLKAEAETFKLNKKSQSLQDNIAKKEEAKKKAQDANESTSSIEEDLSNLKLQQETINTALESAKSRSAQTQIGVTPFVTTTRDTTKIAGPVAPTGPTSPTGPTGPTKPPGITVTSTATSSTLPAQTKQEKEAAALEVANKDFTLPDTLFKHIPSLNKILKDYVNTPGMTPDALRKAIRDDVWFKQNSAEIKARYVQLYNYQDLVATGQATGNTDYEKQIAKLERSLTDKARVIGSGAASDPAALRRAAENMYLTNQGIDDAMTTDFLAAAIRPINAMIGGKGTLGYSGEALAHYQTILDTARNNGFQLSDILPGGANEQQVLTGIANGSIDINRVQQDARKLAAQGQPQYVRDLLSQGYDLSQVFAPYRKVMGTVLEMNPDQIDINDPLLRTAITDKGDMNLYDFKKALRQDNRWQYTEQAKSDVSTAAFNVLKDFGFQG